jgi:hypothetical protein
VLGRQSDATLFMISLGRGARIDALKDKLEQLALASGGGSGQNRAMTAWENEKLKLHPQHGWRARPGCKIFVADRGAVRFEYPRTWFIVADEDSVKLYDKQPPHDDSRLAVSYVRLPPIDWSGLPVAALLEAAVRDDERATDAWEPIREQNRADLEIAWREARFIDPGEKREARSRICIARRSTIQCLLTFDFWAANLKPCDAVWSTVLETLELGELIADPTRGPLVF